ncbi:uncharacterized protein PG986_000183 [Apiospora aurea]|uniref:Uncharacterized protein n=1 Tax=Apiospora aurea TaxID=335848 RepID=A0ABR1QTA6_9PEZI
MKSSTIVTAASACLLQTAAATSAPKGCCRTNQCLQAIGSPLNNGVADCSTNLVVTVTVAPSSAVTVTETATQTGVDTALFTEIVTETAATETLLFTTDATTAPSTITEVSTATSTTVAHATATPSAVVVPQNCRPVGPWFRGQSYSLSTQSEGPKYMYTVDTSSDSSSVSWAQFSTIQSGPEYQSQQWVLDAHGQLQQFNPTAGASEVQVAYVDGALAQGPADTVPVAMMKLNSAQFLTFIGAIARVQGCVSPDTNALTLRDMIGARSNILQCGTAMVLSRGDGSDFYPGGCTLVTMEAHS